MRRLDWGFGIHRPRQGWFRRAGLALLTALGFFAVTAAADPAEANRKYAAIVIDGKTGEVLFSRKADYRRYPASLTKVMTLYMLFEALDEGKIKLTDKIPVSRHAASMPPSDLRLKPGEKITVEKAIKALIVRSANDVAAAVGEKLGGTEYKFALKMSKKAKEIGMKRTRFRNASGLYHRQQVTTARDMATLALRIQKDFPQYYHYFKSMKVTWKGRTWNTHNRLMKYFPGADGLKTGYIRASGFNLITSARRGNMHLVGVVMGGRRSRSRDRHMVSILERNFERLLKRDKYVYPIADRLPEVRPKPNFAAIEAKEWLQKHVGVVPRPSPFEPERPVGGETVVAEKAAETAADEPAGEQSQDAESGKKTVKVASRGEAAARGTARPASGGNGPEGKTEEASETESEPVMPVLAASGAGNLPAGGATAEITDPVKNPDPPQPAELSEGQRRLLAGKRLADKESAPDDNETPQEAIARLIEEGDGQVAGADVTGEGPEPAPGSKSVQIASAGPATPGTARAMLGAARQWGVQVGAFTSVELAEIHLDNAERLQPEVLTRDKSALVPKDDPSGKLYRARFGPMNKDEAEAACATLKAGGMHCFALETDDWGQAVRRR